MTLIQLHYFKMTCEMGSVQSASQALHVAASTISQSIKELEREFGLELLMRTNRGVSATSEGQALLEHARIIIAAEEETTRNMRDIANSTFSITLGIPTITCDTIWPVLSRYIYRRCPGIKVNIITTADNAELLQKLRDGKIDATIMIHPPTETQDYSKLTLWPCPKLALIVSTENHFAKKDTVTFEQILDLPLVRHISDNKANYLRPFYEQYGKEPRFIETCEQLSTMIGLVRNNVAAAYLNTEIARHYGGIKALLIPDQEELYYYMVWSHKGKPSKALLKFLHAINGLLLEIDNLWPE